MAYEEPRYNILEENNSFEIRDYEPYIVAEVEVRDDFKAGGARPKDSRITLRQVPATLMAARRYSGSWSERNYRKNETMLLEALRGRGLKTEGAPVYARYNSPFSLWFMRRNEVLVQLVR